MASTVVGRCETSAILRTVGHGSCNWRCNLHANRALTQSCYLTCVSGPQAHRATGRASSISEALQDFGGRQRQTEHATAAEPGAGRRLIFPPQIWSRPTRFFRGAGWAHEIAATRETGKEPNVELEIPEPMVFDRADVRIDEQTWQCYLLGQEEEDLVEWNNSAEPDH